MTAMIRGFVFLLVFAVAGPLAGCEPTLRAVDEKSFEQGYKSDDTIRGVRVFRPRDR